MNKNQLVVLLDLGGVVFQSTGQSNPIIDWEVIAELNEKFGHELNIGANRFPDFMMDYNSRTDQNLTGRLFLEHVFDTLEMNGELIEKIREKSSIVIVSDNYRENIEYISERFNFAKWAIHQIYSYDYRMVKSDALFFERLKEELRPLTAENMILIDDSIEKIESAARSGIKGILFKDNEQTLRELEICIG